MGGERVIAKNRIGHFKEGAQFRHGVGFKDPLVVGLGLRATFPRRLNDGDGEFIGREAAPKKGLKAGNPPAFAGKSPAGMQDEKFFSLGARPFHESLEVRGSLREGKPGKGIVGRESQSPCDLCPAFIVGLSRGCPVKRSRQEGIPQQLFRKLAEEKAAFPPRTIRAVKIVGTEAESDASSGAAPFHGKVGAGIRPHARGDILVSELRQVRKRPFVRGTHRDFRNGLREKTIRTGMAKNRRFKDLCGTSQKRQCHHGVAQVVSFKDNQSGFHE